jgi:ABC-2 type transport system ATP-binding protein
VSHAVEVDALAVRLGDTWAVREVSLSVARGETLAVLGPNGAGKTTTLETILGFRRPTSGSVRVDGRDPVTDHRHVTSMTGAVLQRAGVWAPMTPAQCLALTAAYYAHPRPVGELLERLGLASCASTPWRRLSGGEQQRTLIALAFVGRPRVLLLDEPTAAIDPAGHQVVRAVIEEERATGCAVVVATHDLADAEAVASTVVILQHGTVLLRGAMADLTAPRVVVIETSAPLDVNALSRALDAPVTTDGPCRYRCAVAPSPVVTAAVADAVAAAGAALVSLRSRATLEETYLDAVAESECAAP